jgi:hypothetical protein
MGIHLYGRFPSCDQPTRINLGGGLASFVEYILEEEFPSLPN